MATCNSCGGVIGRDCFNPVECAQIAHQQEQMQVAQIVDHGAVIEDLNFRVTALEEALKSLQKTIPISGTPSA